MSTIKGRGAPHNQESGRYNLPSYQADGDWIDLTLSDAAQAAAYDLALPRAIHDARLGRISPNHWAKKCRPS